MKTSIIEEILKEMQLRPVLVDIGSSGDEHEIWKPIASQSSYVGFDPDLREIKLEASSSYFRKVVVNKAVVADEAAASTRFFLTHSPYCSSTLQPNLEALKPWAFRRYFEVVREARVPAANLNSILNELDFQHIDWLKIDTQGSDLKIIKSLNTSIWSRLLAIEVEPGLLDAYIDEDKFGSTHEYLLKQGFWLSDLNLGKSLRMNSSAREKILPHLPDDQTLFRAIKGSPGWCEGRYLRSIEWLNAHDATLEVYYLLMLFGLIDTQWGFCLELTAAIENRFPTDSFHKLCRSRIVDLVTARYRTIERSHKWIFSRLPEPVKKVVKRTIRLASC